MKKIILLLILILSCSHVFGQGIWNKKLPFSSTIKTFSELSYDEGSYWISLDNGLFQMGESGEITGKITTEIGFPPFWVSGKKINPTTTGSPYFLLGRLTALSGSGYTIACYHPDSGIVNQAIFADSLTSVTQSRGPVFVTVDDSTLLVFGHKTIRKIQHRESGSIKEAWTHLLSFKTNDALWIGNMAIFCDAFGNFKSINASGNLLWEKTHPFTSKSIKLLPDGIIGCGNAVSGEGVIFKLDFNGNLLWSKILTEQKLNDLTPTADGSIFLTGETDSLTWLLLKTDGLGNKVWIQSYENGKGWEIEPSTDGGAVVLWHTATSNYQLHLAKIDALGNTVPAESERSQVTERTLCTSGAKTTQYPLTGLFFDGNSSRLRIPADSATSPIFVHSLWLGGYDDGNNLHLAANTYGNGQDFRSGLVNSPTRDFERLWSVSREEITIIRRDYEEDGHLDTPPPFDLLTWPAKGNPHFRQNLDFSLVSTNPDSFPAPFIDYNGDGTYNVFDGDYPRLLGDQMLWWARTDQTVHEETDGQPLLVDVFFTLYGYDCPQNGGISQSIFADYQVINRSGGSYQEMYMGFFTDFDLGCFDDDYVGSLPDANSFYTYNIDGVDGNPGSGCAAGLGTYAENIPVESVTMLNHTLDNSTYSNRPFLPSGPSSPAEFYTHLQGLVCGGQLPTTGGTGCNSGSTNFTHFVFPDNPSDPQGWSMCAENLGLADRRMLNSHGPFNFAAGDTFSMRLVFTFHPDIPHPCPDVYGLVKPTIQQIQQWYDDGTLDAPLDLGSVQILQAGQSLTLNATVQNATSYAWSTGANTPSITVNQTSEYTVTVTRASGCTLIETVLIKAPVGTTSPTLPDWKVQPNPAGDLLKIIIVISEMPVTALLRNTQGQTVVMKSSAGNTLEISVANLPAGLYWAELWREGQFLGSRKVVVARF